MTGQFTGKTLKGFYALEGIDGAGKTTLVGALKEKCKAEGVDSVLLFHAEPTDSYVGLACRNLLASGKAVYPPSVAAYLFAADRYSHLYAKNAGVLALVKQGKMVLTDRYFYSSVVYQACMEDSRECMEQRRRLAWILNRQFEQPEKVFFLKCEPSLALQRQKERAKEPIDSIVRLAELDSQYERTFGSMETVRKLAEADPFADVVLPAVVRLDASKDTGELADIMYKEIFS